MKTVCIKARALRTIGYDNIKEWDEGNDNHIAAVRRGRVPVNGVAYVHKKSKWCNGKSLEVSDYYDSLVESTDREEAITELSGKIVGCFCLEALLPTPKLEDCVCHVQALRHFVEDVPILPEPVYDAVLAFDVKLGWVKLNTTGETEKTISYKSKDGKVVTRINKSVVKRGHGQGGWKYVIPENHVKYMSVDVLSSYEQ